MPYSANWLLVYLIEDDILTLTLSRTDQEVTMTYLICNLNLKAIEALMPKSLRYLSCIAFLQPPFLGQKNEPSENLGRLINTQFGADDRSPPCTGNPLDPKFENCIFQAQS